MGQATLQSPPPPPLQTAANYEYIHDLPVKKYNSKEADPDEDVCAICLDEYEDNDEVRILDCHHEFHKKCIDPWLLTRSLTCPTCKSHVGPIPAGEEESEVTEATPLLLNHHSRDDQATSADALADTTVIIDIVNVPASAAGTVDVGTRAPPPVGPRSTLGVESD